MDLADDGMCFACGQKNEEGLRVVFELLESEKKIRASFIPAKKHQGYVNIVHGGIIGTLLDEAMVNLAYRLGFRVVTARMEIRFKQPALVGEPLSIEGEIVRITRRVIEARASALNSGGGLIASSTAKLMVLPSEDKLNTSGISDTSGTSDIFE